MVCHLQAGNPGQPVVQSEGLTAIDRCHGSSCMSGFLCQAEKEKNLPFLHIFVLFRPSIQMPVSSKHLHRHTQKQCSTRYLGVNDLLMIVDLYVHTQGNWVQEDNFFLLFHNLLIILIVFKQPIQIKFRKEKQGNSKIIMFYNA